MYGNREASRRAPSSHAGPGMTTLDGTLPLRGLRYMASPSIPGPTLKATAGMTTSAQSTFSGQGAHSAAGAFDRLQPLGADGRFTHSTSLPAVATATTLATMDTSNFFAETLSSIGPSARRLLMLDAAAAQGREPAGSAASELDAGATRHGDASSDTVKARKGAGKRVGKSDTTGSGGDDSARGAPAKAEHHLASTVPTIRAPLKATLDGTLTRTGTGSRGVGQPPRLAHVANSIRGTSLSRNPAVEPALVATLRGYLERELYLAQEGAPIASALDQLGPYREVFGALISAFPGYATLLSDVKSAYENVVQLQAELLTEAYATEQRRAEAGADHKAEVRALQSRVDELGKQLHDAQVEMEEREAAREESEAAQQRMTSAGARADNFELRRQVERAHNRIAQLEDASKGDLEKILLLIGAVRECDRRVKELESSVDTMAGQVEELDEFKRLAGEAQTELQRYKEKYRAFVPASDFEAMKEYLVAELAAAQSMVKRLRRTAAVRGTQLDVLQRRVALLEHDGAGRDDGYDSDGSTVASSTTAAAPLTPRPDWAALESALPELAEEARPIHAYPLPLTAAGTSSAAGAAQATPTTIPAVTGPGAGLAAVADETEEGVSPSSEVLVVRGPDRSAMRAAFLVERVRGLCERVASLERECEAARRRVAQSHAEETTTGNRHGGGGGGGGGGGQGVSSHRRGSASRGSVANNAAGGAADTWHMSVHSGTLAGTGAASGATGRAPPMPLVGRGLSPNVPSHLRCVGFVKRTVVDADAAVRLTFEFFLRELAPIMTEDVSDVPYPGAVDVPDRFHGFLANVLAQGGLTQPAPLAGVPGALTGAVGGRPLTGTLAHLPASTATVPLNLPYSCAAHLAMNLEEDARDPRLTNPAILLNSFLLRGVMPVRLAVEAVSVVERIVADLNALAVEAQKPRLQRSAISECLAPVLELRTAEEIAELRATLGTDATFDVLALTNLKNRFLRTLFLQECQDNMAFYTRLVRTVTEKAEVTTQLPPSARKRIGEGDYLISLENVAAAVTEVEPLTPGIVVRELSENAIAASEEDPHGGGRAAAFDSAAAEVPGPSRVVKLSEVIRALGDAPVIRRTRLTNSQGCIL